MTRRNPKKLASGRSPRWALMEKFVVPNYDDETDYLIRWRLIQTPLFGVFLHRFDGPDPRDTLHDHPWPFVSFVLRGGYIERRLNPLTMDSGERTIRFVNRMPAHGAHAILRLLRVPTWTLMFVGRRVRTWGYWDYLAAQFNGLGERWTWTEFDKHPHAAEFDAALARRKATT